MYKTLRKWNKERCWVTLERDIFGEAFKTVGRAFYLCRENQGETSLYGCIRKCTKNTSNSINQLGLKSA